MRKYLIAFLLVSFPIYCPARARNEVENSSRLLGASSSDAQVTAGLKELLLLATTKSIQRASAENGFWGNQSIKIGLPEPLISSEQGLRLMGQGLNIDQVQFSMNRVAEAASPSAGEVLNGLIKEKDFSGPRAILNGGSIAATEDLSRSSFLLIVKALRPAVVSAISKTSAQQQFNLLANQYTGLTLGGKCQVDLADYLTGKIVAGLLSLAAQEEASLRANPEGTSDPLRKILAAN